MTPEPVLDDVTPSRRATDAVRRTARTLTRPSTVRGAVVEAAWIAAHVVSYPFGMTAEREHLDVDHFSLADLPPVRRGLLIGDVEAAGTPILLVHGFVDNRSIFAPLRRSLTRRGFGRVWTMNYRVWTADVRVAAQQLANAVEELCEETGYERVHVIGHSMGGLIARYYVQRLGGYERVHTLLTLGTPHQGTRAAKVFPRGVCQQMAPGSDIIAELAEPAPECTTRFVSFWSDIDAIISPKQAARVEHPDLNTRNVFIEGVGHMSLPIDRRIVREICATLAYLDADGGTVTPGVTWLEPAETAPAPSVSGRIKQRLRRNSSGG